MLLLAALVAACQLAAVAHGELQVVEQQTDEGQRTVYKMTVTPAAEPVPALAVRLTLRELEFQPGNAAVSYLRAFPEGGVEGAWRELQKEYGLDEVHSWYSIDRPLDKLPQDKVRLAATRFESLVEGFVRPASQRRQCDWGHRALIAEVRGPDVFAFLLPDVQAMRSVSRALMMVARAAMIDHDHERVIDLLRMNYRLGMNVSQSPFLVSGLVGIAICGMGSAQAIELIASPGSPNLYWALAELPQPLIDLRSAARSELSIHKQVFPFMADAETANHTPDEWARLLAESLESIRPLSGKGPTMNEFTSQAAVAGLALVTYDAAKERLVGAGMDADAVARMPVGQVIAIDAARQYRLVADELEKWWYVSDKVAKKRAATAGDSMLRGGKLEGGLGLVLARMLLPALQASRQAQVRLEWQLRALQTVEAIRMHAAKEGKLPAALDEITVVPVPDNPITGQPYQYRLDGETALLELPFSDGFNIAWTFEITLAK